MKRILWISRHQMTEEQYSDLLRIVSDTDVELMQVKDSVSDISTLSDKIAEADFICAVLPLGLLAQLVKLAGDTPVLQAVSLRKPTGEIRTLPDGRQEPEFRFVHGGWEQITRLEFETKML